MAELLTHGNASTNQSIKQEEGSFGMAGAFDSLDILATIATQELKIGKNSSKSKERSNSEDVDFEMDEDNDEDDSKPSGKGSVQPKKLAEMDIVNMEQIRSMSANTLVRIFAETDFDEMKRMYCYSCLLIPGECRAKFQSFGNESKAKKEIRQHLEEHVDNLVEKQQLEFTAEPILARKRRIKDLTSFVSKPQLLQRKRVFQIKTEPSAETEASFEKENSELLVMKKRKDDLVPLLSEISNDQELKRYRIKNEKVENNTVEGIENNVQNETAPPCDIKQEQNESMNLKKDLQNILEIAVTTPNNSKSVRIAIDEDHCYAFKPGRVKAEYWPEYDMSMTTATAFTAAQEEEEPYSRLKQPSPSMTVMSADLPSEEAIQSCPVIMEGEEYSYAIEDSFQTEYIIDSTEEQTEIVSEVQNTIEPEKRKPQSPEYTTIVYQDQVVDDPSEQYYTETIVTDVVSAEEFYGAKDSLRHQEVYESNPVKQPLQQARIKNKRTVAAVSSEDKRLALNAMEELRSRGATTDDLMCRLCDPARPFTAYSTLLTHYRSHAGLRPFECSLCGATFTRQHSLNYHLMTHANQTRFTCPHCNRKFRHPTHFKEHVKKHGEVVQFLCNFCPASLSTQSQYRKHIKMRHSKTIDIMGNIIDSPPDLKDRDKVRRKRRTAVNEELENGELLNKRKRRKKTKEEGTTEISQYEEVVQSSTVDCSGSVIYEETIPMHESEEMYRDNTDYLIDTVPNNQGLQVLETQEVTSNTEVEENVVVGNNIVQYIQSPQFIEQKHDQRLVTRQNPSNGQQQQVIEEYASSLNGQLEQRQQLQQVSELKVITSNGSCGKTTQQVETKSPMIFVVPNGGEKEKEVHTIRKPLIINEQKKPIMISKFQTKPQENSNFTKIKQGVIAQINGQKVLLVPKKKQENIILPKVTGAQKIQQTMKLVTPSTNSLRGKNIIIQTSSADKNILTEKRKDTVVKVIRSLTPSPTLSHIVERPKLNENNDVYVMPSPTMALTEINPNRVQNTVAIEASKPEMNIDSKKQPNNILEQAMHEVFPSSLDFAEEVSYATEEVGSDEASSAEVVEEACMDFQNEPSRGRSDLYNPMRSPLKNRNQILCEVLGIDS